MVHRFAEEDRKPREYDTDRAGSYGKSSARDRDYSPRAASQGGRRTERESSRDRSRERSADHERRDRQPAGRYRDSDRDRYRESDRYRDPEGDRKRSTSDRDPDRDRLRGRDAASRLRNSSRAGEALGSDLSIYERVKAVTAVRIRVL